MYKIFNLLQFNPLYLFFIELPIKIFAIMILLIFLFFGIVIIFILVLEFDNFIDEN